MSSKAHRRKQAAKQRRIERLALHAAIDRVYHESKSIQHQPNHQKKRYKQKLVTIESDDAIVLEIFGSSYFCMKDHG